MPAEDAEIIEGEVIEETSPPEPEPKSPSPKKKGRAGWYVALLLTTFIGGLVAFPYMRQSLESLGIATPPPPAIVTGESAPDYSETIAALEAQARRHNEMLAQLSDTLATLSEQENGSSSNSVLLAEIASLKKQVAEQAALLLQVSEYKSSGATNGVSPVVVESMKTELASLREQLAQNQNVQNQALGSFANRLDGLEAGTLAGSPRGRLYLALQEVRTAALSGQNVVGMLTRLLEDERFVGETNVIRVLESIRNWFADNPAPVASLPELRSGFEVSVRAFTQARHKAEGSFLQGLFTVRETGKNASGDDARLLSAEKRLSRGDIAGALDELALLEAPAKDKFAEWIQKARHHILVAGKLDTLLADVRGSAL